MNTCIFALIVAACALGAGAVSVNCSPASPSYLNSTSLLAATGINPTFAGSNGYAVGKTCFHTVNVFNATSAVVTVTVLLASPSSDRLEVFQGWNTTSPANLVARLYGRGYMYNATIYVPTQNFSVSFISDPINKGTSGPLGYRINARPATANDWQHCNGMSNLVALATSTSTSSVQEPATQWGVMPYLWNATCGWLIQAPAGLFVKFTLDVFQVESAFDSLTLYDGSDASAPLITGVSGNQTQAYAPWISSGRSMYVTFRSTPTVTDPTRGAPGFRFTAGVEPTPLVCPRVPATVLASDGGTLVTPNFPIPGLVFPPGQCMWQFEGKFPVEHVVLCLSGYYPFNSTERIQFYDGTAIDPTRELFFNNDYTVISATYQLLVVVTQDANAPPTISDSSLLVINYQTINSDDTPICIPSTSLVVDVPQSGCVPDSIWPSYYGPQTCAFSAKPGATGYGVFVYFSAVDLAPGDYVEVTETDTSTVMGSITSANNNGAPVTFRTASSQVDFVFHVTSGLTNRKGFSYTAARYPTPTQCLAGQIVSGSSGIISAPVPFGLAPYTLSSASACTWLLTGATSKTPQLILRSYDLAPGDRLSVYAGSTAAAPLLATFTGASDYLQLETISGAAQNMFIVLETSGAGGTRWLNRGFNATFSTINPTGSLITCAGVAPPIVADSHTFVSSSNWVNDYAQRLRSCRFSFVALNKTAALLVNVTSLLSGDSRLEIFDGAPGQAGSALFTCAPTCPVSLYNHDGNYYAYAMSGNVTIVYTTGSLLGQTNLLGKGFQATVTTSSAVVPTMCQQRSDQSPGGVTLYLQPVGLNVDGIFSTGGRTCAWGLTTTAGGHFTGLFYNGPYPGVRFLVYDGLNASAPLALNCTGHGCDSVWKTTGNTVYVVYQPPSMLGAGETLPNPIGTVLYEEIPPATMCSDAPIFASYSETIFTQYYAASYYDNVRRQVQSHIEANMNCPAKIYAPPGYQLIIDMSFDLDDIAGWRFKITGNIETANPIVLVDYAGALPDAILTPVLAGNQAQLEFTTGPNPIYIPRAGFALIIRVTKAPVFCNGYQHIYAPIIGGYQFAVTYSMPELESGVGNLRYPPSLMCTYDIETAPGMYLMITLSTTTEYLGDIITIYEGDTNGPVLLRTSGDTDNLITSRCHRVVIVFAANNVTTSCDHGFSFTLQAVQYLGLLSTTPFNFPPECRSSISRGVCNWRQPSEITVNDVLAFSANCIVVLGNLPQGHATVNTAVNWTYLESMTGEWCFETISQTVFNFPKLKFLAGMETGQLLDGGGGGGGGPLQSFHPRRPIVSDSGNDESDNSYHFHETSDSNGEDIDGAATYTASGLMRPLTQISVGGGHGPGTGPGGGGVISIGGADPGDDPSNWPPPSAQANFSFPALSVVGCLTFYSQQYTNYINMSSLVQANSIYFNTIRTAKYVDLSALVTVTYDFYLYNLVSLQQLFAPKLRRVGHDFTLVFPQYLPSVDFPALESVLGQHTVEQTRATNITWPRLERVGQLNMALLNSRITSLSAPKLVSGAIYLLTQKAMQLIDLPVLWTAPKDVYMRTLPVVANITLPNLRSGGLLISDMAVLTNISAPELRYSTLQMSDVPNIPSLNLPEVVNLAFDSTIQNNRLLASLIMCNLRYSVSASLTVANSPALSCFDLQTAYASLLYLSPVSSPQCSDVSGIFGCYRNTTLNVRPDVCGYNVACIQNTVNQALRHALVQVYVPAGTYTGCAAAPLDLAGKDITLFGEGPATTVIDCQGAGRAMVMQTGEKSTTLIHSMGFTNGVATTGGLVYIKDASPILYNCAFDQSTATGSGGAVALVGDSHPILSMVTFTGNAATSGGALSSDGSFILTDATFTSNSAAREGGAIRVGDDSDGRLTNLTRVTMTLNQAQRGAGILAVGSIALADSTLRGNTATQLGGGAMLVPTAALGTWYHVSNTLIESNTALHGGGVYSFSGNLDLSAVNIHANSAQLGGGMFATCNENYRFLNGINGYCDVMVRMDGVRVASNVASVDGGGLALREVEVYVTNSTLFRNGAAGKGGGMQVGSAALTWRGGVMSDNSASYGGGVHVEAFTGTTNITSALITRNTASTAGAGAFLCTAACPGYNTSNDASVTTGVLPNLPAMNTFVDNDVDESGYGSDVGTDPAQLIWESAPPSTMISGQPASIAISVTIEDYFRQPVSSRTSPLLLSLFVRLPGANEATSRVSIQGGQSVIATKGRAEFTGANFVASNISYVNADYDVECRLSALSTVAIRSRVTLMPCTEGQGIPGQVDGPINCQFCPAGTIDVTQAVDACQPCAPGSFSARIGSTDLCEPCPVNTTAKQAGAVACDKCADGQVALLVGSTECATVDAITGVAVQSLYVPVLGALAGFFCIGCLAAIYMCRYARRRTLKKYYLDNDSTVRTGSVETPLQKEVKKMILAASTVRLGGGVFADVYKARYNGRWVALKVLKGEMVGNSIAIAEFQRETVALSRLSERAHPGIVGLNFFLQKNPMSIGVEFCEMGTVKTYITQPRAFPDLARLVAETAAGMTVLHELSIAHLDLKTDNLLLDVDCHVKIADFGISRTVGNDVHLTPSEFVNGSLKNVNSTSSSVNNGGGVATRPTSTQGGYVNNPVFGSDQHENGSVAYAHAYAAGATTGAHSSTSSGHSGAGIGADKRASRPISQGSAAYGMPSMGGISASEFGTTTPEVDAAFTPQYVDPARITQSRLDDLPFLCEADVYSYAMVMWAMASQAEPYAGIEPMNLIAQLKANPNMRPDIPVGAPKFYVMLMARCWDADRSIRPTFRDIAHELATTLQQEYGINLAQTGYWA